MTTAIGSVSWKSAGGNSEGWSAQLNLDFAAETNYAIAFGNNVSDQAYTPEPRFMYLDNTQSNSQKVIQYGPYSFTVLAFQQNKYQIPRGVKSVSVSGTAGICTLTLTEFDTAPNPQYDQRGAIQDANPVDYSYVTYSATRTQLDTDSGKSVLFTPTAGDMDYSLLDTGVTAVKNGFVSFFKNLGTKNVLIKPTGGLSINGFWTSANPIILKPGQSGTLTSDGTNWYYQGEVIIELTIRAAAYNAASLASLAHGFPRKPKQTELYVECVSAEFGWSVGDRINLFTVAAFVGAGTAFGPAFVIDATTIYLNYTALFGILTYHKTTAGLQVNLTGANWKIVAVALLDA